MQKCHFIKNNLNSNVASINHFYVKSKKRKPHKNRVKWWLPEAEARGIGEMLFKSIDLQIVEK